MLARHAGLAVGPTSPTTSASDFAEVSRRAPVQRRVRPRLDGCRGVPDPRTAARRLRTVPARWARSARSCTSSRSGGCASASAARSETQHRPRRCVGRVRRAGEDRAETVLGQLAGRRAVIVGAGSMGALTAATLRRRGVAGIVVANRSSADRPRRRWPLRLVAGRSRWTTSRE